HIGERMRRIALQSAVGGIALSMIGMVLAVMGMLPPLLGAIAQEAIDLLAILNAARVVAVRRPLADYHEFVAPAPPPRPRGGRRRRGRTRACTSSTWLDWSTWRR